jgi:class 3 adenylate cyclase
MTGATPQRAGLAFADPELERVWWAWYAAERGRVMRGGVAVLLAGVVGFAPFDVWMYPEAMKPLLALRGASLAGILLAVPAFFGPRSDKTLSAHGQEWLLYVATVAFAGLGSIGFVLAPRVEDTRLYVTLVTLCLLLAALYGATGLRVRYAALLGIGTTVLYTWVAAFRSTMPPEFFLACLMFGGGFNLLGVMMSQAMERESRQAFLRARDLREERARSDALLLNVMPRAYADRLGAGPGAAVDRLADAAVLFATVVGFEAATQSHAPLDAVALLDRIVAAFDELAAAHGVERIKTIGATCMAMGVGAGGVEALARVALAMRDAVEALGASEGAPLTVRAGIASGPLVVGVIGRSRYAFDCWGDTVNTAARLDAAGEPGRVQVSGPAAAALAPGALVVVRRGLVLLKGKGEHETFWVDRP